MQGFFHRLSFHTFVLLTHKEHRHFPIYMKTLHHREPKSHSPIKATLMKLWIIVIQPNRDYLWLKGHFSYYLSLILGIESGLSFNEGYSTSDSSIPAAKSAASFSGDSLTVVNVAPAVRVT